MVTIKVKNLSILSVLSGSEKFSLPYWYSAGGLLVVEFTTFEGRDGFSSVAVRGRHDPTVAGCVRQATADLRFEPQTSWTFTEEYMP